jgi:hypothetical protein
MKITVTVLAIIGLTLCALFAGCTSPTQSGFIPFTTETPTDTPTQEPTVTTQTSTPVQVQTLPAEQYVSIVVSKERPDSTVHLLYNGGKGETAVQYIMMRVTTPDGKVTEKYLVDGTRKPRRGDELIMQGSNGSNSDHIEVFVTSAGTLYKILDEKIQTIHY